MQRVIQWQPECERKRRKALPYTSGHLSTCIPLQDDEESCSLQVPPRGRAVQHGGYVVHHAVHAHKRSAHIPCRLSPSTVAEMSSKHQQNSRNQTPREPKDGWRDTYVESTDEFSDDSSKEWSEASLKPPKPHKMLNLPLYHIMHHPSYSLIMPHTSLWTIANLFQNKDFKCSALH